jgi:hypothetical protein
MLHERVCVSTVRYLGPHLKHPASVAAHLYSCLGNNEPVPSSQTQCMLFMRTVINHTAYASEYTAESHDDSE